MAARLLLSHLYKHQLSVALPAASSSISKGSIVGGIITFTLVVLNLMAGLALLHRSSSQYQSSRVKAHLEDTPSVELFHHHLEYNQQTKVRAHIWLAPSTKTARSTSGRA